MHDNLVQLYQKRLKQTSNKKVRPHEIQEGNFMPKKYYLSNQTPGASGRQTIQMLQTRMPMRSRNTLSKITAR